MKYSESIKQAVQSLSELGLSSRKIANELGISKSGVNDLLNRTNNSKSSVAPVESVAKILVFDLETSASKVYCFGRNKQYISQSAVSQEGGKILTASWKWLGSDETCSYGNIEEVLQDDDSTVCATLWELFEQADAVIAHNACNFDMKVLRTRCLANGLPDLPTVKVIDTLLMARKHFRFNSNKLDSLGAYLGLGRKIDTGGIDLWIRVQEGCDKSLQEMIAYNIQDVELLENIYYKLRGYGHSGTNFNAGQYYNDGKDHCAVCGSTNVTKTGRVAYTAVSAFEEVRCTDCGSVHRTRKAINSSDHRATLSVKSLN